ncbi:MAG TPA: PAS domain S-box protein [Methanospirillum sp.]|jgi:PAS domain S-box-containing protein|nr:PAS domain S-box protein [Methanospirillum sp.]HPY59883.1 PAS domain S-box protein [Methanospirillum sp.]
MKEPFQVLYVDDEEFLLDLARLFLERSGDMVVSVTTSPHEVLDHMESGRYDAIISDYEMPVMNGIELLKAVRERDTTFPFILFTGRGREEVAIEALNNGANFYLQKGGDPKAQFAELAHKVRQAILLNQTGKELHRSHQELSRASNRYKAFIAASNTGAWEYHSDTGYTWCSAEYFSMLGRDINAYDHAGAMNVKEVWEDLLHPDDRQKAKETFLAYVNRPVGMYEQYFRMLHIDGHYVWIWSRGRTILDDDGTPTPITVGTHIDITRQKEQEELLQKSHDEIQAAYDVIAKTGEELRASLDRLTIQEQALRESEEKFRTLFESAADGILILEDGKILDCNHQAEVLFRLSKNALIGRSPADLTPPFQQDGVLSHDLCAEKIRAGKEKGPIRFECMHLTSDGREFFAEVTLQQISIQGRAYLQAFIRDISDRKRAEMELIRKNEELATAYEEILSAEAEARESQDELIRKDLVLQDTKNRLDDIIAFLPDATFAIDREGMVIAWNRAMEEMTGVMAEDMMGKGNYEYSLPFYNERRPMLIDLALTGDETIADRYPTISRKGSFLYSSEIFLPHFYQGRGGYFWFTSCPFFDHDGNITGAIECIRDITDRKRVEEALEKHLVALTRTIPGVVYQFYAQPNGKMGLGYVSKRAEDILGVHIDFDTFFDRFTACVDERDREAFLRSIEDAVREEKPWEFEGRFIKPSGEVIWFQGSSIPVREGDSLTFSGIILDVTRRKQIELELLKRNEEREETLKQFATLSESLREANKKLALLSSITRHDILNRVSVLMGYLDLAADLPAISDELMIYLKKCSSVTSDIARQIEFTRIYQDIGTHDPLWQRLNEMVGNVSIPQDISLVYVPTTVEIYADAMMVKVLENLFENAYRHGGTVTTISISTRKDGDRLVILVEDDGAGIADDEKERIFERGYGKNTGLGLFLAREILAITGISISETGVPGKGARFEITVPEGRWR